MIPPAASQAQRAGGSPRIGEVTGKQALAWFSPPSPAPPVTFSSFFPGATSRFHSTARAPVGNTVWAVCQGSFRYTQEASLKIALEPITKPVPSTEAEGPFTHPGTPVDHADASEGAQTYGPSAPETRPG